MVTYEKAKTIIESNMKDSYIDLAIETRQHYVFSMRPKRIPKTTMLLDSFYSVDKRTGKFGPYPHLEYLNEFKNALKNNVIYRKGG